MKYLSKIFYAIIIVLFMSCVPEHKKEGDKSLFVSENGRYLTLPDGRPFFYLGDTAWELFHKLNREEATIYLENRAEKGFTVIQAVLLAEMDGLRTPNPYGEVPLLDMDPSRPNEKYFEHVDFIVNKAEELGLFIGMLPTWGDKVTKNKKGYGPVVFNPENARTYGEFLGNRYKEKPVIWILGGDVNIFNNEELEIWRAMAKGIKEGDKGNHLITYHPYGHSFSSYWLHNEEWLDFNMYQSGHNKRYNEVYEYAEALMLLQPVKPFVDGEPAYEDIMFEFWKFRSWSNPENVPDGALENNGIIRDTAYFKGFILANDVRVHAYWNLLSGACGYTYGNLAVCQMFKKGGSILIPCLTDWKDALDRPGADDMRHVRALFESRPFTKLIPDQSLVYGLNPKKRDHIRCAISSDHSFALLYAPTGQVFTVVMKKMGGNKSTGWWYNPRNGDATKIGELDNAGLREFIPPSSGVNNDWILVLDEQTKNYPAPGDFKFF